jgi:type II secretory pathway pseudopilin PulG
MEQHRSRTGVRRFRRPRAARATGARSRAGFSLIEALAALSLLTVALCGIVSSIVASDRLQRVNQESALAEEAVRRTVEALRGAPFPTVFAAYNSTPADDPVGAACPGASFAVEGLQAAPGDADGLPGEISFPTQTVAGALQLREDVTDAKLGMPRDLNGDGAINALNHAGDYRILPVRVRVRWNGASGVRTLTAETVLCAR